MNSVPSPTPAASQDGQTTHHACSPTNDESSSKSFHSDNSNGNSEYHFDDSSVDDAADGESGHDPSVDDAADEESGHDPSVDDASNHFIPDIKKLSEKTDTLKKWALHYYSLQKISTAIKSCHDNLILATTEKCTTTGSAPHTTHTHSHSHSHINTTMHDQKYKATKTNLFSNVVLNSHLI